MFGGGKTISTYGIPNPKREYKRITGFMLGLPEDGESKGIEDLGSKLLNRILHKNTIKSSMA